MASDVNIGTLQEFIALVKRNGLARTDRFVVNFAVPQDVILLCEEASFPGKTIDTRTLRIHALNEQRAHTITYGGDMTLTFIVDNTWRVRDLFEGWLNNCIGVSSNTSLQPSAYREVEFYDNYIDTITITALAPFSDATALPPVGNGLSNDGLSAAVALVTGGANDATSKIKGSVLGVALSNIAQQLITSPLEKLAQSTLIPSSIVPEQPTRVAEVATYSLILHEAFPKSIESQPMSSNSANQIHRLKVTFAYKYYTVATQAASPQIPTIPSLNTPF